MSKNKPCSALNGYGPLPDIDQHSNSLPPPPPPGDPGNSNYAAINPSEGHYSRLEYGGGNGHVMAADGVVYGVLGEGGDPGGGCHVMGNMMATPEDFDDTASVSVGGGGHYDVDVGGKSSLKTASHGLMMIYADRLGLNERGCQVAAALAAVVVAFFVIIVSLAVCWPGRHTFFKSYFDFFLNLGKVITFMANDILELRIQSSHKRRKCQLKLDTFQDESCVESLAIQVPPLSILFFQYI